MEKQTTILVGLDRQHRLVAQATANRNGLRKDQIRVLQFLSTCKQPQCRRDIADGAGVDYFWLTSNIGSYEPEKRSRNDKKWWPSLVTLDYVRQWQDGRHYLCEITSDGRKALQDVDPDHYRDRRASETSRKTSASKSTIPERTRKRTRNFSEEAIEGLRTESTYFKRNRNRKLRDTAFEKAQGVCAVCNRNFSELLAGEGRRLLQVHHQNQLSAFKMPKKTRLEDLAVVCANCHCLLHVNPKKTLSVEQLKTKLRSETYP